MSGLSIPRRRLNFREIRTCICPVADKTLRLGRAGAFDMFFEKFKQRLLVRRTFLHGEKIYGVKIAVEVQISAFVVNVCYAASHARRKIDSNGSENRYGASSHVFAAMVAYTFRNKYCARVADAKAFACLTVDVDCSRSRAICDYIARDDIVFWAESRIVRRPDRYHTAGERTQAGGLCTVENGRRQNNNYYQPYRQQRRIQG